MNRTIEKIISIPLWPFLGISTVVHWEMTKENCYVKRLKKASYSELKDKMNNVNWRFNSSHPTSLFDANDFNENYFHASIFRFGDTGYLLTPYGYLMANILQRKIRKTLPNYEEFRKPYIK